MRLAGDAFSANEDEAAIASSYEDRIRHRNEAKILYDMIMKGELGDPNLHQDTLKQLQNQISGIELKGV